MGLLLQSTGQAPGGNTPVSGKQSEAPPSSDFSRLLARQYDGSLESQKDNDLPAAKDRNVDRTDGEDRKPTIQKHSGKEAAITTKAEQKEQDSPPTSLSGTQESISGPSLTWSSMPGFLAAIEPLGMLNFSDPNVAGTEAVPANSPAGLADKIATQFTDRNGVQTLTLKLDPGHLGKVEARLQVKGDQLSVRLLADNREAETALRQNIKELADAIQEKTGKFQQVDVRVELKSQGNSGNKNTGQNTTGDDSRNRAGQDSQGSSQGDPEPENGGNPTAHAEQETASGQWTQGG